MFKLPPVLFRCPVCARDVEFSTFTARILSHPDRRSPAFHCSGAGAPVPARRARSAENKRLHAYHRATR